MGLFDKFKKKKEDGAQAAQMPATTNVEATPEQNNNAVDNNAVDAGNQAVVANVGLESNPFVEQSQVTEQPQEVEQVQPSFDNVFNADPSTLIDQSLSETNPPQAEMSSDMQVQNVNEGEVPLGDVQQTAAVVDNPMPATVEQNGIEVNPQEMFSNEIPKEDEITQMVAAATEGNGSVQTDLPTEGNFEINMSGSTNPDEFIEASELVETPENANAVIEQTGESNEVPREIVNETINENINDNNVVEVENTPDIALQTEVEPANNEVPIQTDESVPADVQDVPVAPTEVVNEFVDANTNNDVQNEEVVEITNSEDNSQTELQPQVIASEMPSAEINDGQVTGEENTLQDAGTLEQNVEGPVTQDSVVTEDLGGNENTQTDAVDNTVQDFSNIQMVEPEIAPTEEAVINDNVQNITEEETQDITNTDQVQTQIEAMDNNELNGEEIVDIQATDNFIPTEIAESQNDVIELQTPEEVVEPQNIGNDVVEIVAGEPQETVISPAMIETNEPEETEVATSENETVVTDDTINDTDYKEEAQDIDVAASPIVIPEVEETTPVTENENVQIVSEDNNVITESETTEENGEEAPTTEVTEDVTTDEETSTDEVTDIKTVEEEPEAEVTEEPVEETPTVVTDEANVEEVPSTETTEQDSEEIDKEPTTTEEEAQEESSENEITEETSDEEAAEGEEPPKEDETEENPEEETKEDEVSEEQDSEEVIVPIVPMESDEQQEDDVVQDKEEDLDNEEAVDHVLEAIAKIDASKKEVKDSKKKQEQADSVIASIINGEDETEDDEEEEEDITENSDDKPLIEEDEEHVLPLIEEKEDDIVIHTDNKVKPLIEEEENEIKILSLDDNDNKHKNKKDFTIPPFAVSVDGSSVSTSNVYLKQEELLKKAATYIEDPTPTKFCDNCGTILTEDCSICPSCGEPID